MFNIDENVENMDTNRCLYNSIILAWSLGKRNDQSKQTQNLFLSFVLNEKKILMDFYIVFLPCIYD
jgi:hypothetical protein